MTNPSSAVWQPSRLSLAVCVAVGLACLLLVVPAMGAQPQAVPPAGGIVSVCDETHLRAALAGGGTVTFACSGMITLTEQITVTTNTTIDGSGQAVTISGNDAVRVFYVNTEVTLNLNELTLANGSADYGGGVRNNGKLNVSNSTFFGNSGLFGGGIYNDGTLHVNNSAFSSNSSYHYGSGIYIYSGTALVSHSTFSANGGGAGGGIHLYAGEVTVSHSTFTGNNPLRGGGIYIQSGTAAVSNSSFFDNSSLFGGGIYQLNGTLTVHSSTFSGNSVNNSGSSIYIQGGTLTMGNSTFSGNSGAYGGGISSANGAVTVSNSTFAANSASSHGSGIAIVGNGTVRLENTIVANNQGEGCYGTITDGGGNLSYPDTTCPGINADPKLGPLQNNGGPTQTIALGPGSAAIDAAIDAICAAPPVNGIDQRGVPRPQGSHCDIGAVEQAEQATPTPTPTQAPFTTWAIEAEQGVRTGSMVIGTDPAASACQYVADDIANSGSTVTFAATVPYGGSYYLWARVKGLDWNQNSFWVSVNGATAFHYEIPPFGGAWIWVWDVVYANGQPGVPFQLNPGANTLRFQTREANTRLDRVFLVNRAGFTPAEIIPCNVTPTATPTPTSTNTPTFTPTPTPTSTNTPTFTPTPTPTPMNTQGRYFPFVPRGR